MNLYILRHASAGTSRTNPALDAKRPLDKEGKQHCLQLAHILNAQKISFDLILASPLKRAVQTAQLLATETGYEAQIVQSPALTPAATFGEFKRLLDGSIRHGSDGTQAPLERENVLCVGHNPTISLFLGSLLVNAPAEGEPVPARVRLRKGSLARLSLLRGSEGARWVGTLLSLVDPRTVRALYKTSTVSSRRSTSRK